ncbi:MAG: hypothetical protein WCE75_05510, partial [Terracidiphilus sp.]
DGIADIRQQRFDILNKEDPELPRVERALERTEGIARFVEEVAFGNQQREALENIIRTRDPAAKPLASERGGTLPLGVANGEYYYSTGYALARLLDACDPSWKKKFAGKDLFEVVIGK